MYFSILVRKQILLSFPSNSIIIETRNSPREREISKWQQEWQQKKERKMKWISPL